MNEQTVITIIQGISAVVLYFINHKGRKITKKKPVRKSLKIN